MDPVNVPAKNLKFVALPIPDITAIAILGWGCERECVLGEGEAVGVEHGTV